MSRAVLALVLAVSGLAGQTRPDFSGKWTLVSATPLPPNPQPEQVISIGTEWTNDLTLKQDAATLTVDYVSFSRAHAPVTLVYAFDGTERRTIDRNGVAPQDRLTRATWRGAQLVLTTVIPRVDDAGKPEPMETTHVLSLDAAGLLKIEVSRKWRDRAGSTTWLYRRAQPK
jgi:hypothetical protein